MGRIPAAAIGLAAISSGLGLAGCGQGPVLYADHGYVRLPANPHNPAAVYFILHGGPTDTTLINVTSPLAIKSEMHAGGMSGNMATMAPMRQLRVPAKATLPFAPGGRHVMLFDLDSSVKPGGSLPLELAFGDGTRIQFDAITIAAGDPTPKS